MKPSTLLIMLPLVSLACGNDTKPKPGAKPGATAAASSSSAGTSPSATSTSAAGRASGSAAAASAPARPLYYERAMTKADLAGRSLRELSLLRNTIYARVGNSFRRPWLNRHFSAQSWYKPKKKRNDAAISKIDRENARLITQHDSGLTREQLEKIRAELLSRRSAGKSLPEDAVELSLLSQRLGVWLGDAAAERSPLEDPSRLDQLITVKALETLSRRDLRILRNTIYARRGRAFASKVVRSYFAATQWYKPKADYDDSQLSQIDAKNIAIVRSVEDSLGGPVHENPNYGKEGWFVAA